MKKTAIGLVVFVSTFLIGVFIANKVFDLRRVFVNELKVVKFDETCGNVVSVESQPNAPLRISGVSASCPGSQGSNIGFRVENVSDKPVIRYEIRAIRSCEYLSYDDSLKSTALLTNVLLPGETKFGFMRSDRVAFDGGVRVGDLKSLKLTVWSVTLADGTTWVRAN